MGNLKEKIVDICVTSPPTIRETGCTVQEYKSFISQFYLSVKRLLSPGGYLVVNFFDAECYSNPTSIFPMQTIHWPYGVACGLVLKGARIWKRNVDLVQYNHLIKESPIHLIDYEHIWTWHKPSDNGEAVADVRKSKDGVIGSNWLTPIVKGFRTFPLELPIWAIKSHITKSKARVLDPFARNGVTLLAAKRLGHNFIGIENDDVAIDHAINKLEHPYL